MPKRVFQFQAFNISDTELIIYSFYRKLGRKFLGFECFVLIRFFSVSGELVV